MGTLENPQTQLVDGVFKVKSGDGFEPVSVDKLWIGAERFGIHTNTPTLSATAAGAGGMTAWLLQGSTADEAVSVGLVLPTGWNAFSAEVYWSNGSTGAGTVRFDVICEDVAVGEAPSSATTHSVTTAAASTTAFLLAKTTAIAATSPMPVNAGSIVAIRVNRDQDHAGDTVANDICFHGLLLSKIEV